MRLKHHIARKFHESRQAPLWKWVVVIFMVAAMPLFLLMTLFLAGCDAMQASSFNFSTLQRNTKPNSFLVCPQNLCTTRVDATAPIFNVDVLVLQKAWTSMIAAQPRIEVLASNNNDYTYQYVQRSFLFRFPDVIDVKLIAINNTQSTLAIYSHAVYGYYDFNVNKKRVKSWLSDLSTTILSNKSFNW